MFVSNSASASNPELAGDPFFKINLSPNNSLPLSIFPLPFRSSERKASSVPIHAVFSANPLLSRSKLTPSLNEKRFMPSLPKSIISGSEGGVAFSASV